MSSSGSSCRDTANGDRACAEIAVVLGPGGLTAPLHEPGRIVVFRRDRGAWEPARETTFALDPGAGLRGLRHAMQDLLAFLGGCRVVIARTAKGVPYFELEKARCTVWEIAGDPAELLEEVWQEEAAEAHQAGETSGTPVPEEITPGNYYVSIKELQEGNAGVSSKQVLQGFVRRGAFRTLVVRCSHVPPWLSAEAMTSGCTVEIEQVGIRECRVKLTCRYSGGCC
ncbi:MAG: Fe-only nitrogenase accessory AnfO family protein [Methanospirillum sp.]